MHIIFFRKKILLLCLILIFNRLFMDLNKQILSRRPIIIALIAILVVLIGGGGFWVYRLAWAPNFKPDKTVYVYIDDKKDFNDLCRQLRDSANCLRIGSFKQLSGLLKYPASCVPVDTP